jgi:septum site-determining protein MinD
MSMGAEKIAVISGKGGVGKTTISANLGTVMAHVLDRDVTIIDTDISSSHLGVHMGFQQNPATINSALKGEHDISESVYEHETGVDVVPGALNYADAKDVDVYDLPELVATFEDEADVILLDCSPGLDRETSAALRSADKVLYVSRPSFTSIIDVIRAQSLVDDLGRDSVGIILNMVRGENYEVGESEIESFTELPVIGAIPFDTSVEESASQGTPAVVFDPHCPASRAIEDLAIDLLDADIEKRRDTVFRRVREFVPRL